LRLFFGWTSSFIILIRAFHEHEIDWLIVIIQLCNVISFLLSQIDHINASNKLIDKNGPESYTVKLGDNKLGYSELLLITNRS
jgi:hypothetical protein